jgi:hypothetical protein
VCSSDLAVLLANGAKLKTSVSKEKVLTVLLPSKALDPIATVIKITVKGEVDQKPGAEAIK